jgi:hypothetical protein
MSNSTKTPHGDRTEIEQVPDVVVNNPVQQVCDWARAHKLDACRGCNACRIEELGLGELIPALRSTRDGMGLRS